MLKMFYLESINGLHLLEESGEIFFPPDNVQKRTLESGRPAVSFGNE